MSELEEATHNLVPRILHKGVYTLYEKPDGTLRIQYRRDDKDEDDFMEIPGGILRMAKLASEGKLNPIKAMQAMKSGNYSGSEL